MAGEIKEKLSFSGQKIYFFFAKEEEIYLQISFFVLQVYFFSLFREKRDFLLLSFSFQTGREFSLFILDRSATEQYLAIIL